MKIVSANNEKIQFNKEKSDSIIIKQDRNKESFENVVASNEKDSAKIYKTLKKHNIKPTKELIEGIKENFKNLDGSLNKKIEALDTLLSKGIELNDKTLKLVFMSLDLKTQYDDVFKVIDKLKLNADILIKEGLKFEVKEGNKILEDNFSKDEFVFEVSEKSKNKIVGKKIKENKNKNKINKNEFNKKEISNNDIRKDNVIENLIEELSHDVQEVINEVVKQEKNFFETKDMDFISGDSFKKYMVVETTNKMIEVKKEFKNFKKNILNDIDNNISNNNIPDKERSLVSLHQKIEKIVMKSNITLFTSMKQERKLVKISSILDETKQKLAEGKFEIVDKKLKDVKKMIKNMNIEFSKIKIKGVIKKQINDDILEEFAPFENFKDGVKKSSKSPRLILENLRLTGVNHESEVVQNLEYNESNFSDSFDNLKGSIFKILKSFKSEDMQDLKNFNNQITGNQLINKLQVQENTQQINLSVPYMQNKKIKSLNLFIQGKKDNQILDWKNTTIYFVVSLEKFGKTGIKISTNHKLLNINIKTDNKKFENVSRTLFEDMLEDLSSEGYIKGRLRYSDFSKKSDKIEKNKIKTIEDLSKGFDLKI